MRNEPSRPLSKHGVSPCSATLHDCQTKQMQRRSQQFSPGELEDTIRTPLHHVDEDYPAGPGII